MEGADSVVAIVLVACLATGVILASDVFGSGANVETLLFGSLLLIDSGDIALASARRGGDAAGERPRRPALAGARLRRRRAAVGRPRGARPRRAAAGLIALATTAALSVIGALLVASLFVVPAITARLLTRRLLSWQLASVALVALEGTVGLWLSVKTDAPPGATIACVSGAVFALVAAARALAPPARAAPAWPSPPRSRPSPRSPCSPAAAGNPAPAPGQIEVVATTTQIGDWVREVGGSAVSVDQVLQPNTDPHEYEPRPSDIEAAANAALVFANGDDLDGWVEEIVDDSGSGAELVDLGAAVPDRLPGRVERGRGVEVRPALVARPAQRRGRGARDRAPPRGRRPRPPPRVRSATRAPTSRRLRSLDRGIARCFAAVPPARRKLVTDHDAFGYFAHRYGIEVVGAVIPSQTTQAQPSAQDLSELAKTIEAEGVTAIFPESSLSPKVAEAIARQTGASADHTLYGDTLGPAGSSGATYLGMEEANADAMARGFTEGRRGCPPSP